MQILFATRATLLSAAILSFGTSALGQTAHSVDELRVLLKRGDQITLTGDPGGLFEGRVLNVSAATLALQVNGILREFSLNEIRSVTRREHASLGKAGGIGFGIGAGATLLWFVRSGGCDFCGQQLTALTIMNGALGAAAGVGIAAATARDHLIFTKINLNAALSFAPLVDRGKRGVRVSWEF